MFDSGISAKSLIEELKNTEVDIAYDIPNATYVSWLNSLQQILYRETIKEQKRVTFNELTLSNPISISDIPTGDDENKPRFEDIHAVYADGVQLIKSTVTSGIIFDNTYYKTNNDIGYNTLEKPTSLDIIYIVKPALITVTDEDEINDVNVMIPVEFIDLVKAKLRGEAYKLVNEGNIAANWLNDYNILLEIFKTWIAEKTPKLGI
jgi:hypothetical protein